MRIGIDGGCLSNRRGFGRFARQLVAALSATDSPHQFVMILDRPSLESVTVPETFETVIAETREAPSQAASAQGRRRLTDLLAMARAAARARLDLLYFPASYSYFPVWSVPKAVVTLHDTLPLAHPELVFPTYSGRLAWWLKEQLAVRQADRIVTVSEASRRDLEAWFRLPPGRVQLITEGPAEVFSPRPPGAASDEVLTRYGIEPGSRYLLYVGGLSPHKNLPRLIEAYAQLHLDGIQLILVGDLGDVFHTHVPALRAQIERLALTDRARLTGFVPDADLAYLYSRAEALVQPSLVEGFGLPPVEAMACGTPVLHSRAGSLPEVIGDAGLDFDPTDVSDLAATLRRFLLDPTLRPILAARASRRAERFTWPRAAQMLMAIFDEVLSHSAHPHAA